MRNFHTIEQFQSRIGSTLTKDGHPCEDGVIDSNLSLYGSDLLFPSIIAVYPSSTSFPISALKSGPLRSISKLKLHVKISNTYSFLHSSRKAKISGNSFSLWKQTNLIWDQILWYVLDMVSACLAHASLRRCKQHVMSLPPLNEMTSFPLKSKNYHKLTHISA